MPWWSVLLDYMSWVLLMAGCFVCVVSSIGLLRMPDFYTRVHAASLTDTLGAFLILAGCFLQVTDYLSGWIDGLIAVKLVMIMLLLVFLGPVATHTLAQTAIRDGIEPKGCQKLLDNPLQDLSHFGTDIKIADVVDESGQSAQPNESGQSGQSSQSSQPAQHAAGTKIDKDVPHG